MTRGDMSHSKIPTGYIARQVAAGCWLSEYSGLLMKKDQEQCLAAGCDEFLSKPVARDNLISTLSRYLQKVEQIDIVKELEPVTSVLLKDEPDMFDLIEAYIEQLPDSFEKIREAESNNDWQELRELMHKMKGTAGGYGYPDLTQLAAQTEFQLINEDYKEVSIFINKIETYIRRIIVGFNPDSHIVSLPSSS